MSLGSVKLYKESEARESTRCIHSTNVLPVVRYSTGTALKAGTEKYDVN